MPTDDQRAQVKTQSFDSLNKWNYLDTDTTLFDRMILVVLTDALTIKTLYDVPSAELRRVLRVGKEQKPTYHFSDLEPWRTDVSTLSGFQRVAELVEREACRGARVWGRPSNPTSGNGPCCKAHGAADSPVISRSDPPEAQNSHESK